MGWNVPGLSSILYGITYSSEANECSPLEGELSWYSESLAAQGHKVWGSVTCVTENVPRLMPMMVTMVLVMVVIVMMSMMMTVSFHFIRAL